MSKRIYLLFLICKYKVISYLDLDEKQITNERSADAVQT